MLIFLPHPQAMFLFEFFCNVVKTVKNICPKFNILYKKIAKIPIKEDAKFLYMLQIGSQKYIKVFFFFIFC